MEPSKENIPVRPDGLQVDERKTLQARIWLFQRVSWLVMLILVALAIPCAFLFEVLTRPQGTDGDNPAESLVYLHELLAHHVAHQTLQPSGLQCGHQILTRQHSNHALFFHHGKVLLPAGHHQFHRAL